MVPIIESSVVIFSICIIPMVPIISINNLITYWFVGYYTKIITFQIWIFSVFYCILIHFINKSSPGQTLILLESYLSPYTSSGKGISALNYATLSLKFVVVILPTPMYLWLNFLGYWKRKDSGCTLISQYDLPRMSTSFLILNTTGLLLKISNPYVLASTFGKGKFKKLQFFVILFNKESASDSLGIKICANFIFISVMTEVRLDLCPLKRLLKRFLVWGILLLVCSTCFLLRNLMR